MGWRAATPAGSTRCVKSPLIGWRVAAEWASIHRAGRRFLAAPPSVTSSRLLRVGNGFKPMDRAFAGRFPFGFGHVRSAVPELHAGRQTLATTAWSFRQGNTGASAGGKSRRYGGGVRGRDREWRDW